MDDKRYKVLLAALEELGFPEEEAKVQIKEVGDLVVYKFTEYVVQTLKAKGNSDAASLSAEEFQAKLKENFTQEEIKSVFAKVSDDTMKQYFTAITRGQPEEKVAAFNKKLSEIVNG